MKEIWSKNNLLELDWLRGKFWKKKKKKKEEIRVGVYEKSFWAFFWVDYVEKILPFDCMSLPLI